MSLAQQLVDECRARSVTIATAESLTAGLVAATLAQVPGCSQVLRGGVVAYATDVKSSVLGVADTLLEHVVSEEVAAALAESAAQLMDADLGIGTTGVAGPDRLDDQPPGTVWIAVHDRRTLKTATRRLGLTGDRQSVREGTVDAVLAVALGVIQNLH